MSNLSASDYADLLAATRNLETQSFAMKVAAKVGIPIETLLHMLPKRAQASVGTAVNRALEQSLRIALKLGSNSAIGNNKRTHTAAVALTGALGGFFGLPGLLIELPVTTTLMLHSIVEIARSQGEDFSTVESALACLEVFALGADGTHRDALESAYYVSRAGLAQATREAAMFVVQKGVGKESAPALISFLAKIASRFGLQVSEKVAAEIIPIAGAAGGLTLNILFSNHFQTLAEGHFTIRRLERTYGIDVVRQEYEHAQRLIPG